MPTGVTDTLAVSGSTKRGDIGYIAPAISGSPERGDKQKPNPLTKKNENQTQNKNYLNNHNHRGRAQSIPKFRTTLDAEKQPA